MHNTTKYEKDQLAKSLRRQKSILKFIDRYIKKHSISPSRREIADNLDVTRNAATYHINKMISKGEIAFTAQNKNRNLALTLKGVKLIN